MQLATNVSFRGGLLAAVPGSPVRAALRATPLARPLSDQRFAIACFVRFAGLPDHLLERCRAFAGAELPTTPTKFVGRGLAIDPLPRFAVFRHRTPEQILELALYSHAGELEGSCAELLRIAAPHGRIREWRAHAEIKRLAARKNHEEYLVCGDCWAHDREASKGSPCRPPPPAEAGEQGLFRLFPPSSGVRFGKRERLALLDAVGLRSVEVDAELVLEQVDATPGAPPLGPRSSAVGRGAQEVQMPILP